MENHFIFIAIDDIRWPKLCDLNAETGNFKLSCIQCGTFESIQLLVTIVNDIAERDAGERITSGQERQREREKKWQTRTLLTI